MAWLLKTKVEVCLRGSEEELEMLCERRVITTKLGELSKKSNFIYHIISYYLQL
uniref:Uncharacterized protein n=1 Tax=Meloidogyne incognita TaxID=6306 RepID=A0A914MYP5_MELIC